MLVNAVSVLSQNKASIPFKKNVKNTQIVKFNDSFNKSEVSYPQIRCLNNQKQVRILSFGNLNHVLTEAGHVIKREVPAIQMKVSGVRKLQDNMLPEFIKNHSFFSVNKLADSNWKDGDPLDFSIVEDGISTKIKLYSTAFGEIGRVPDTIAPKIINLLDANPEDYQFELSNVIAGNTPGVPTIGLRVNLLYKGENPKEPQEAFNAVLNNPEVSEMVFFYQKPKNADEVLEELYKNIKKEYGLQGEKIVLQMKKSIKEIVKCIENNDSFLIVGHNKPDGDCLGSIKGLGSFIKMLYPNKTVDYAVADEIPSLFRQIPEFGGIKHPYSQEHVTKLEEKLAGAIKDSADEATIKSLQESLKIAKDPNLLLDSNKKYDSVILMDIPSPARFTSAFKKWITEAQDVLYIDHHPLDLVKWDAAKDSTGVDMNAIMKKNHAWVADKLAAAAQQSVVIASKLLHEKNPLSSNNIVKTMNMKNKALDDAVAGWNIGIWTDSSGFKRGANHTLNDITDKNGKPVPVQNQPNFFSEGMSKWLSSLTNDRINKKWLRDNLKFVLGYRDKMIDYQISHRYSNPNLGFGYTTASYDEIQDVLEHAILENPATNRSAVVNEMKLSEVMNDLKSSRKIHGKPLNLALRKIKEPEGMFDQNKIAVFISESERKGELNTDGKISQANALRFSFRNPNEYNYAELLASLFNGGGHPPAAGGHLVGDNITLDSTFSVKINGEKVKNYKEIYSELLENYRIKHDPNNSAEDIVKMSSKIEVVEDKEGKKPASIIEGLVHQIRIDEGL